MPAYGRTTPRKGRARCWAGGTRRPPAGVEGIDENGPSQNSAFKVTRRGPRLDADRGRHQPGPLGGGGGPCSHEKWRHPMGREPKERRPLVTSLAWGNGFARTREDIFVPTHKWHRTPRGGYSPATPNSRDPSRCSTERRADGRLGSGRVRAEVTQGGRRRIVNAEVPFTSYTPWVRRTSYWRGLTSPRQRPCEPQPGRPESTCTTPALKWIDLDAYRGLARAPRHASPLTGARERLRGVSLRPPGRTGAVT